VGILEQKIDRVVIKMIPDPILLLLLSVSASFSRNTMDFPCIFGVGKFYFYSFIFSWEISISALYTVDLYLSYVMSSLC
jgi:hypothetical protein